MTHPRTYAELPRDTSGLAPLAESFWTTLDSGLPVLGLTLGRDARRAIDAHVRLLLAWNKAINLTAISEPAAVASRHVLDSLAAVPWLGDVADRAAAAGEPALARIVDIGSGGGFPGLALAAALPAVHVTLVDSVVKKARFLEVAGVAMGLGNRALVRAVRAETLADDEGWDVVTARAVGRLDDLVELALPILRVGGRLLAWKRGDLDEELAAAGRAAVALAGGAPVAHPVTGIADLAGHRIVEVTKLRQTPPGYPRDPARRRGRPW